VIAEPGLDRTIDEQFLELICADEDLLRAEFDAVVTAAWLGPPTVRADRRAAEQPGGGARRRRRVRVAGPPNRPRRPGIGGWARQRGPPPAAVVRPQHCTSQHCTSQHCTMRKHDERRRAGEPLTDVSPVWNVAASPVRTVHRPTS
jgi:hypothetical protein